jgi:NAD(P)-dependent dehydrogenase (short-subunit alcohol dehydrogenase family)
VAVVIVGGTAGLGLDLARVRGPRPRLFVTGRDAGRAEAAAGELGGNARGLAFDLADPHAISGVLADVGPVEHLVLSAIERDVNRVREYDIDRAIRLATLKLVGYTTVIHCLHERMGDDSSILLFGGLAKERPYPGSTTVTSVNGAVETMVRTLAIELAPVRVNALHPGIVGDSPYWEGNAAVIEGTRQRTPTGRLATMADVTNASLFWRGGRERREPARDGGWVMLWPAGLPKSEPVGVDARGHDGHNQPSLARVVVPAQVGAVLRPDAIRERVVVVRLDAGVAAYGEVAVRIREVENQDAALGTRKQILRLDARAVERELQLAVLVEEPDLGELRQSVGADSGKGGHLALEHVGVRRGELGHRSLSSFNQPTYASNTARLNAELTQQRGGVLHLLHAPGRVHAAAALEAIEQLGVGGREHGGDLFAQPVLAAGRRRRGECLDCRRREPLHEHAAQQLTPPRP